MSYNENKNDESYESVMDDINLYKGVMVQKIAKRNVVLSNEITKKKKIINKLFKDRFGKNFLPIKLESLKCFETFMKFFLFSPQSKILSRFPKLKKKFLKEKDINYNELKAQINCGSLLYLSLSGNGAKLNKNINEKFFQISKNYSTSVSKDTISNQYYNVKVLQKNAKRISKILSFKENSNIKLEDINFDNNTINDTLKGQKNNLIKIIKRNNKSRNLSHDIFSQTKYTSNSMPYALYEKFYPKFIKENKNKNNTDNNNNNNNNLPEIDLTNSNLKNINSISHNKKIEKKFSFDPLKKYNSRNINSKLERMTSSLSNNNDNSIKTFSPYATFSHFHNKNNKIDLLKHTKTFHNDFNTNVQNLNNHTINCNKKLIKLINGNIKEKKKDKKEENQEVINLKSILIDKKDLKKKKKKVNNMKQIKGLIKKAKKDIEGEATIDKIRKKELKKFGKSLNIMNNEYALIKVSELFTKAQLKKKGTNYFQEELERLKKKKMREKKVFHSRKTAKMNYLKMVKLKNNLIIIKDKFDKIDSETTHRTIEIKKNMQYK